MFHHQVEKSHSFFIAESSSAEAPEASSRLVESPRMFRANSLPNMQRKAESNECSFSAKVSSKQTLPSKTHFFRAHSSSDINCKMISKRVLIVDDNEVNRIILKKALIKLMPAACFDEAADGQEAVALCSKNKYDLIFMDVEMPKMDGIKATKLIRDILKITTPIIAATTLTSIENKLNCYEAGMNGFILKPFKCQELKVQVDKWLPTLAFKFIAKQAIAPVQATEIMPRPHLCGL